MPLPPAGPPASASAGARRTRLLLLALAATVLALVAVAAPAQAQSFRYWGYYTADGAGGEWGFAQTGPAEGLPADGSVEGWRFAVTGEASTRVPRAEADFAQLCGSTAPQDGSKRVGVVIDYGTAQDAPEGDEVPAARGACALVPTNATGSDVLAAVAELRLEDGGFICGIDGYPSSGCGDEVDVAAPTEPDDPVELVLPQASGEDAATTGTGGVSTTLLVALGAGALLAVVAVLLVRRRRGEAGPSA
jgi:LPXTG-motif cell wall-anchored protein